MSDEIKNALRLAKQGRMPLHQAIARSGYAEGGAPDETSQEAFLQEQLHPELRPSPLVEQMAEPTAQKAVAENQITPKPTAHEFVQQALNKQEPQLPQMDREAYERMKYGAPEAIKNLAYFTPAAPAAAAYDVYQGAKSGDPTELAMAATGLPGRGLKAAAIGAAAMMPQEAQANYRRFGLDWALKAAEQARGIGQGMRGGPNLGIFHSTEGRHLPDVMKRFEGAIPAPSLAITRPEMEMSQFGDTLLVGRPHLAVPTEENPIWRADAYTPRKPQIRESFNPQTNKSEEWIPKSVHSVDPKNPLFIPESERVSPTAENIVAHMKSGNIAGGEGGQTGNAGGIGLVKALASPQFKTIEEIQQAGHDMPFDESGRDWKDIMSELQGRGGLLQSKHVDPESRDYTKNLNAAMIDYLRAGGDEAEFLKHYPKADKFDIGRVNNLIDQIRQTPPSYFEAKPLRPVGMDEFAGALVPSSRYFEDTKRALAESGMDPKSIHLYDPGSPAMRTKLLRERFGEHFFAEGGEVEGAKTEPGKEAHEFEQQQLQYGEPQVPQYRENQDFPSYIEPSKAEAAPLKSLAGVIQRGLAASRPLNNAAAYFEVAPGAKWHSGAQQAWESLPSRQKTDLTREIVSRTMPIWQERSGIRGQVAEGLGGYGGFTNPNLIFYPEKQEHMPKALRELGEIYGQDAMMGVSSRPFEGADKTGIVNLTLPRDASANEVHDIYSKLLDKKLTEGHSTDLGSHSMNMLAGSGGKDTKEIERAIANAAGNKYHTSSAPAFVSFPEVGTGYGIGHGGAEGDRSLIGLGYTPEYAPDLGRSLSANIAGRMSPDAFAALSRQWARSRILDATGRHKKAFGGEIDRAQRGAGGGLLKLGKLIPSAERIITSSGKPGTVTLPGIGRVQANPIQPVEDIANRFVRAQGREPLTQFRPINPEYSKEVASAYEAMKHDPRSPVVKRSYDAMIQSAMDQYKAAKDLGYDIRFLKEGQKDPYAASPALGYADLVNRGRMVMFPTEQGFGSLAQSAEDNPLLQRVGRVGDLQNATANDVFRVVHDLYGHHGAGNPFFRGAGEERAYQLHSQMFPQEALPALASETRGQNSWVNFGPHAERNAAASGADTIYADQKSGVLPQWATELPPEEGTDVQKFIQDRGGKASGGGIGDEVRNALRIAQSPNHAMRLHQTLARHGYATDGAVEGQPVEGQPDESSQQQFLGEQLQGSAPQYIPQHDFPSYVMPQAEAGTITDAAKLAKQIMESRAVRTGAELMAKDPHLAAMNPRLTSLKTGTPFSEMSYESAKIPDYLTEYKPRTIEDVQGRLVTPVPMDLSGAGHRIYKIGENELSEPFDTHGGGDFIRGPSARGERPSAWAGSLSASKKFQNKMAEASPEGENILGITTTMGTTAADSSDMMAKALSRQIPGMKISKENAAAFDEKMGKTMKDFPGILSKDLESYLMKLPYAKRLKFTQALDKASAQELGLPNVAQSRFAINEGRLLSQPQLSTGYSIAEIDPTKKMMTDAPVPHPNYPGAIPGVEGQTYFGGFTNPAHVGDIWSEWWNKLHPGARDPRQPQKAIRSIQTQTPVTRVDQETVDRVMKAQEAHKRKFGWRKGGAVNQDRVRKQVP